jgi:hypothetical protein
MPPASSQNAKARATEGPRDTGAVSKGKGATTGRRGRPPGSPNKPKGLITQDIANGMLLAMEGQVPAEHMTYLKGVVTGKQAVSTKLELQTLIVLLSRNLWGALLDEMRPVEAPDNLEDAIEMVELTGEAAPKQVFRRDVTERLKVLNSLLSLLNQIEKRDEENKTDGENPLIKIWAARGLQGRVAVLINPEPQPLITEGVAREV